MEYLHYWSLSEPPFGPSASRFFFNGLPQRETTAWIRQLVLQREPLGVLICPSGIGATRLLAQVALCSGFDRCAVEVVCTSGRQSSVERTFANLAKSLGLAPQRHSIGAVMRTFDSNYRYSIRTLWMIDGLGKHSVEAMLQLSQHRHDLTIVSTVTPSLQKLVRKRFNEYLGRRSSKRVPQTEMNAFCSDETSRFIDHSLQVAGVHRKIFTQGAKAQIYTQSNGKIRSVSRLARQALMLGASERAKQITARQVKAVEKNSGKAA